MSSRAEAKAKARQEREEAERKEAAAAARKRRLMLLGGVLVAAIAVIAVVVVISQSGTEEEPTAAEGTQQANTLFAGIPQEGNVLGDPDAPVTIEEYIDLQCPFCQRFSQTGLRADRQRVREDRAGEAAAADADVHRRGLRARRARGVGGGATRTRCSSSWRTSSPTRARRTPATRPRSSSRRSRAAWRAWTCRRRSTGVTRRR